MLTTKGVFLTSEPSKDGTFFPVEEIEKALRQTAVIGRTTCLGHDSTKPIGWTVPTSLYFEPGSCKLAGTSQFAETNEEQQLIAGLHLQAISDRNDNDCGPYKDFLKEELKDHLTGDLSFLSSSLVCCYNEAIVTRYYKSLFDKADKDGLIYLNDLLSQFDHLGQGVFKDRKSSLAICAHPYFRKSLSRYNNLNYFF